MTTALLSFWRTDVARDLAKRAEHLLAKTGVARWLWVVGDSEDETERQLRGWAGPRVRVLRHDTGIHGEDRDTRLRRFSQTADAGLVVLAQDAAIDRILIHESDLRSPRDVADRLVGEPDEAVAGWVTLTIGTRTIFYDTFVYRAQGRKFEAHPPYHAVYRPDARFDVESVGSVWSLPAWAVRDGVRGGDQGALGLCAALRVRGVRIRVDPQVPVVQPFALWTPAFVGLGDSRPYTVSPFVVFSTWTRLPGWPLA